MVHKLYAIHLEALAAMPPLRFEVAGFEAFKKPEKMEDDAAGTDSVKAKKKTKKQVIEPLLAEEFEEEQAKIERRGIIYMSRVPPYMKPSKVRFEMEKMGHVHRIFLTPEDSIVKLKRKKFKGNSKQNYTDGWVEFADKKAAKLAAQVLNATAVGGKKRGYYHDDLWTVKYLPGFKWRNLTEDLAQHRVDRAHKLQHELGQAAKERAFYLQKVDQAKDNRARNQRLAESGKQHVEKTVGSKLTRKMGANTIRQRQAVADDDVRSKLSTSGAKRKTMDASVLSKVFTKKAKPS